jgi:uncharacterized protein (DUF1684 family)
MWARFPLSETEKMTLDPVDPDDEGGGQARDLGVAAHAAAVEGWRRARTERLLDPAGWLTLVDRIVLEEGESETPIGWLRVSDGRVWLRARTDLAVTVAGELAGERELHTEEPGPLDRVSAAGLIYELSRNAGQFSLRVKDPEAPARRQFSSLAYYPIDPAWRRRARFEVPVAGAPGLAYFAVAGHNFSLSAEQPDASRLTFVFGDQTNATDTYAGGRFLYASPPAGGEVILDFNFAFNPPCAFTAHAICPAVRPRNRLPFGVTAGERRYPEP